MLKVPIKLIKTAIVIAIRTSSAICIFFIIFSDSLLERKGNGEMADNRHLMTISLSFRVINDVLRYSEWEFGYLDIGY